MAFSAAAVAGSCVGGFALGLLLTGGLCWYRGHRSNPLDYLWSNRWEMVGAFHEFLEQQAAGFRARENPPSDLMEEFEFHVRRFVSHYLMAVKPGAAGPEQTAALESLAGPDEDWGHIHEYNETRRLSALRRFIGRALYNCMIPEGDVSITLLPTDILSVYQRMLTKGLSPSPPYCLPNPDTTEYRRRTSAMLLQYWRLITTYWCSESSYRLRYRFEGPVTRTNFMRVQCAEHHGHDVHFRDTFILPDDDPRMPNVLATHQAILQALRPFCTDYQERRHEPKEDFTEEAKNQLKQIVGIAADMAIRAFSSAEPIEFFWPDANLRPGYDPDQRGGHVEVFGIRQRHPPLGIETTTMWSDWVSPVQTHLHREPGCDDTRLFTDHMLQYSEHGILGWWGECMDEAPDGKPSQEVWDERRRREKVREEYLKWRGPDVRPGWEGRDWFTFKGTPI